MMKKMLLFVVVAALLSFGSVFGQNMGIQLIGGPEVPVEAVSLDDLKIGKEVEIEGFGILKLTSFDFVDKFNYYKYSDYSGRYEYSSGSEADYALLRMDILNTALSPVNFLETVHVKVVFDDVYEYGGWAYQYNFDEDQTRVIHKDSVFAIKPMYQGHYAFGATLPNAVVTSAKSLRIEITIGEIEMTYIIRK